MEWYTEKTTTYSHCLGDIGYGTEIGFEAWRQVGVGHQVEHSRKLVALSSVTIPKLR